MKRSVLFVLLTASCSFAFSQQPKGSNGEKYAFCKKYIGYELFNFLLDDNIRKYSKLRTVSEPPGVLSYVRIKLKDSVYIRVCFSNLKFQSKFNENMDWDMELLYKEKISNTYVCKNDLNCFEIIK